MDFRAAAAAAFLATTLCASVEAHYTPPQPWDVTLLSADAIVIATVQGFEPTDDPETSRVALSNAVVVSNRWSSAPVAFSVRGVPALGADGAQGIYNDRLDFPLVQGERYVLFFVGGAWDQAPHLTSAIGLYPVAEDGSVRCHGGLVYGVGAYGPICARPGSQAGNPVDEDDFAAQLRDSLDRATRRRPELAADRAARVQPLIHERTGR